MEGVARFFVQYSAMVKAIAPEFVAACAGTGVLVALCLAIKEASTLGRGSSDVCLSAPIYIVAGPVGGALVGAALLVGAPVAVPCAVIGGAWYALTRCLRTSNNGADSVPGQR